MPALPALLSPPPNISIGSKVLMMRWHITNFIRHRTRICERRYSSLRRAPSQQQFKGAIKATPHASHHLCFDHDRAGQVYAIHFALTHAGWNFSTCLSQTGRLIVQNNSEDYSQYEIELEPFNFEKITAILGINDAKQNLKNGERDDMGIGDGYLQEMRMVCMDEYEMARDEGSTSEEELEKMRSNLEAIEKAIDASISGPEATGCILYESAAEGL